MIEPQDDETDYDSLVDDKMAEWWQGDVIEGFNVFWSARAGTPLTPEAREGQERIDDGRTGQIFHVAGRGPLVAVVSQTCDLRRTCTAQPFVKISPLVDLGQHPKLLTEAAGGHSAQFAAIPTFSDTHFVDLNLCTTVEKSVIAALGAHRRPGCTTDEQQAQFSRAVARNNSRYAFPNDLSDAVKPLRERLRSKRTKNSAEAALIGQVREVRVKCPGGFGGDDLQIELVFLVDDPLTDSEESTPVDVELDRWLHDEKRQIEDVAQRLLANEDIGYRFQLWQRIAAMWASLAIAPTNSVTAVTGSTESIYDFSIADSWTHQKLDLDHLSDE